MSEIFKCKGFDENVVLTVKNSFIDSELRRILIEEDDDHQVRYHNRSCVRLLSLPTGETTDVSVECESWFNSLSEEPFVQDHSGKNLLEPFTEDFNGNSSKFTENSDPEQEIGNAQIIYRRRRQKVENFPNLDRDCVTEKSLVISPKHKKHSKVGQKPKRGRPQKTEPALDVDGGEASYCKICGKNYDTEINLKKHVRRCHETSQKPCHICGLMVKELSIHVKHQHLQKDVAKYFCEYCGQGFKGYSGYQFHVAGHTGERKYTCGSCGKSFRTSSEAKKCERGHAGIYKWNCSLCSYKCHQKNKFVRHMRTHTKSEPYSCPLCVHRAARKDYLQKHIIKTHTGLSLEQVESLHPNMYHIEEKISFQEGKESRTTEEIKERVRESRLNVTKSYEVADSYDCHSVSGLAVSQQGSQSSFSVGVSSELMSTDVIVSTTAPDDLILRREVSYYKI